MIARESTTDCNLNSGKQCSQERRITKLESETSSVEKLLTNQINGLKDVIHNLAVEVKLLSSEIHGQKRYLLELGVPDLKPSFKQYERDMSALEDTVTSLKSSIKYLTIGLGSLATIGGGILLKIWEFVEKQH